MSGTGTMVPLLLLLLLLLLVLVLTLVLTTLLAHRILSLFFILLLLLLLLLFLLLLLTLAPTTLPGLLVRCIGRLRRLINGTTFLQPGRSTMRIQVAVSLAIITVIVQIVPTKFVFDVL